MTSENHLNIIKFSNDDKWQWVTMMIQITTNESLKVVWYGLIFDLGTILYDLYAYVCPDVVKPKAKPNCEGV